MVSRKVNQKGEPVRGTAELAAFTRELVESKQVVTCLEGRLNAAQGAALKLKCACDGVRKDCAPCLLVEALWGPCDCPENTQ